MSDRTHTTEWKRILIDGIVIVASILLAFAINAWWEGRKDRAKELSYLRMLSSDVQATLKNNARFSGKADSIDWAGARLVRAYYEPEPPPADSIRTWLSIVSAGWVVEPTLATATALISTGDLDLIRREEIRRQVPEYVTNMQAFDGFEQNAYDEFRSSRDELAQHIDMDALGLTMLSPEKRAAAAADPLFPFPSGQMRSQQVTDLQQLIRDAEVHRILQRMNQLKMNMRSQRARMRISTESFEKKVDAALAASTGVVHE